MRINEVRELNNADLRKQLSEQKRALMSLRFRKATRQISDTDEMRKTRKIIARVNTVIRERQIVAAMRSVETILPIAAPQNVEQESETAQDEDVSNAPAETSDELPLESEEVDEKTAALSKENKEV